METKVKKYMTRILCILGAIALWLYVTYVKNPEMELWLRDIPVTYASMQSLEAKKLAVLENEPVEDINIKVRGSRSALMNVRVEDIIATVDYSAVGEAGDFSLPISVQLPSSDLRVVKQNKYNISVKADTIVSVEKEVVVTADGAEEYGIHSFSTTPERIRVTGAKSLLDEIRVEAYVDLQDGTAKESYKIYAKDKAGKIYYAPQVAMSADMVSISAVRALPIELEIANLPENLEIESVETEPETVEVEGNLSDVLMVESIKGAYAVWLQFEHSPAKSGTIPLVYPNTVQAMETRYASGTFYFTEKNNG